jgi:hypothetical protein
MKQFIWTLAACLGWPLLSIQAQELPRPANVRQEPAAVAAAPQHGAPQAWSSSYQRESSREYLRRRAQEKAEARQARIEGLRWLGFSASRPTVSTTPFTSHPPSWGAFTVGTYWQYPYWYHPANFAAPTTMP